LFAEGSAQGAVAQTVLGSLESATGTFGSCGTRFVHPSAAPSATVIDLWVDVGFRRTQKN
jgi:hypothetical protein